MLSKLLLASMCIFPCLFGLVFRGKLIWVCGSRAYFHLIHCVLGDANFLEDESTKIFARKVADHYSARSNQTLEEREASPIIHLKKLNNWVCVLFCNFMICCHQSIQ